MKYLILLISIIICIFCVNTGYARTVDSLYEVGLWQGFRTAAVCFSFDDLSANQLTVALPMFDGYGFKMTFYPVIDWSPNWTALQNAASNGHEVGSHTVTHVNFSGISSDSQMTELRNSQNIINSNVSAQKCITIAYPYCAVGDTSICRQFYIAARGCSGAIEPSTPANFMNISSIVCGILGSVKTGQDFINRANSAASSKGLVVFLIHGINGDGGYSRLLSDSLDDALTYLYINSNKFWVSTFSNIARYIKERNDVSVTELTSDDTMIVATVTDSLDDSIFHYPVTVRRVLPAGWTSASVSMDGRIIESQIVDSIAHDYIMFDVPPDSGEIIIKKRGGTKVDKYNFLPGEPELKQNYPNPFNPSTKITFYVGTRNAVSLRVYDILGREIKTLVNGTMPVGEHTIEWDGRNFSGEMTGSGVYFYRLQTGSFSRIKKLILLK